MRYAINRPDGGVSILIVAEAALKYMSLEDILKKDIPKGLEYRKIELEDMPNRIFRNAWNYDLKVDMEKAKSIHINRIRIMRNIKLEELDKEQLKVLANPVKLQEIESKKQILRDLPASLNLNVNTPEELANVWSNEIELHDAYKS